MVAVTQQDAGAGAKMASKVGSLQGDQLKGKCSLLTMLLADCPERVYSTPTPTGCPHSCPHIRASLLVRSTGTSDRRAIRDSHDPLLWLSNLPEWLHESGKHFTYYHCLWQRIWLRYNRMEVMCGARIVSRGAELPRPLWVCHLPALWSVQQPRRSLNPVVEDFYGTSITWMWLVKQLVMGSWTRLQPLASPWRSGAVLEMKVPTL